jgi:hypothetical protein
MASKNIVFDSIPSSIRKPGRYVEFNTSLAVRTLPANQQHMLIVAQRLAIGTVPALVPTKVFSDADAALYTGAGSMTHLMVRAAIKANPYLDLTICTLDDGAGVAATSTITIANAATAAGALKLYIGNRFVEIAIANLDAAAAVATALNAEIGKYPDFPVTAAVVGAVVTLTARNTADTEALEHHAWVRGINRKEAESDADLLARLLDYIRRPPAGGNKSDYVKWARAITGVKAAYCIPLGQGPGSVDVVIVADVSTGSEVPSPALLDEVRTYIDDQRPVTAKYLRVLAPEILYQDVVMSGTGANYNPVQTALDIASYLEGFAPGQTLYRSQLGNIAILNGAEDYVVTTPAANVVPAVMQTLRPGATNVT